VSPERWLVLTVESPSDELMPLLAEGLVACGGPAVEERGRTLTTYVAPPADVDRFIEAVESALAAVAGERIPVRREWRGHEDWAEQWKRGLEPRRVGERLIVTPTWRQPEAGPDDIVLAIDPEMAFGTGEHATTRAALRLLEKAVRPGTTVLDIGTGSGILAIAAARLGAAHVDAAEMDAEALPYAEANILRNGAVARVRLEHAQVDPRYLAGRQSRYDLILANVLSGVLEPLLGGLRAALRPGGEMVLGGILVAEVAKMVDAVRAAGMQVVEEDVEDEWWTVRIRGGGENA
jgi:ribosomal protein L11 methyltransferase